MPQFIPQDEVEAHKKAFREAGINAKTAQAVVDKLVEFGRENEKRQMELLEKSLNEDKLALQKEFGSDYETKEISLSRYFHEENIPDDGVKSLVSAWGFQKTFPFFDRYAQMNKEPSAGGTFVRKEGNYSSQNLNKIFSNPEFIQKLDNQDPKALGTIKRWALEQAISEQ